MQEHKITFEVDSYFVASITTLL